jgi:hypothetical protein
VNHLVLGIAIVYEIVIEQVRVLKVMDVHVAHCLDCFVVRHGNILQRKSAQPVNASAARMDVVVLQQHCAVSDRLGNARGRDAAPKENPH